MSSRNTNRKIRQTNQTAALVMKERVDAEMRRRFNPLSHWTPPVLERQLNAWTRGEFKELAWLMEWIENHDDTILSVAMKAKAAVSRLDWEVAIKKDISPEELPTAEKQKEILSKFYSNIDARDALEPYESGGVRLLVSQVMDAFGKGKAVHHVQWQVTPDGLRAKTTFMPLWFFEQKSGELKFLTDSWLGDGESLDQYGDFMVSVGAGVMKACVICKMYKIIPMQDWLTYCDRSGMAAFIGKTKAKMGSPEWQSMMDMVGQIGAEFNALVNVGDEIQALDLSAKGTPPYEKLIDIMNRAMARLWRGSDLSTMSRAGASVGASVQQEETLDLDQDNADWVSETINSKLSKHVLEYYFGTAPKLVEFRLVTKARDDEKFELEKVKAAMGFGVQVSKQWFLSKFNIEEAEQGEQALALVSVGKNAATSLGNDRQDLSTVVNAALAKVADAQASALAPVTDLIDDIITHGASASDEQLRQDAQEIMDALPGIFGGQTIEVMAQTLREVMEAAAFSTIQK